MRHFAHAVSILLLLVTGPLRGEELASREAETVAQLAERTRPSLVTINATGRERGEQALGTGFIISPDGLIVTNLHVIGEGRRFTIQTHDRQTLEVEAVHASDRDLDLAVLKVKPKDRELTALQLADSDQARDGMPVVVMGNPLGLRYSVVSGVVSGRREMEGRDMLQLAVPLEPGNSGGPVVDMQGRVHGVVTMKSLVAKNLGFAIAANMLKPLLDKPNSVPLPRWLTIGSLDASQWKPLFGADWQQRGGRVLVSGTGQGFGGRSLCLSQREVPELPFEIAVQVKLDDESGAAGLVFHSDGGDLHYGFYPSNGQLRLSRFDGPNVFSWNVLKDLPSEHYRPLEWNRLKVRIEQDKLLCYVNGHLVIESNDNQLTSGRVGLAKFRQTAAEFRGFAVAASVDADLPNDEIAQQLATLVESLPSLGAVTAEQLATLSEHADASGELLARQARELEQRAEQLRRIAADVRSRAVVDALASLVRDDEGEFNLLRAALLVARLDGEEIDLEAYEQQVDRMVRQIRESLPEEADAAATLAALDRFLFRENGFHGSRFDYYHRANSYINRVLDDRVGLPITLAVLYMELGERLGLTMEGVGLPGHFVVRLVSEGDGQLIDVYHEARRLSREDAARLVQDHAGRELTEADLEPSSRKAIVLRMLGNLRGLAQRQSDRGALLRYLDAALALEPTLVSERGMRAMIRFETGRREAAIADVDWFLEHAPEGLDLDRIRELRSYFERR